MDHDNDPARDILPPIRKRTEEAILVLTGPNVILTLKIAVAAVTVLLAASLIALAIRSAAAARQDQLFLFYSDPGGGAGLRIADPVRQTRRVQLFRRFGPAIAAPAFVVFGAGRGVLPVMYFTGRTGRGRLHFALSPPLRYVVGRHVRDGDFLFAEWVIVCGKA